MNTIRVLIVDDEKPGRERLKRLVDNDARIELLGCCASGAQALELVRDAAEKGQPVNIVFLDVQMPEIDGFTVLSSIIQDIEPESTPAVVFVTAYDEYALRAFEAHATDYLLKPFSDERFQAAMDCAIRHVKSGRADQLVSRMQTLLNSAMQKTRSDAQSVVPGHRTILEKLLLKGPNRVRLLSVDQISWIGAEGMYVKLHTRDGNAHLHRGLLGSLDAMLDERRFVRIHRSTIVNIDVVEELRQDAHGDYIAVLRDRTELRVGRRFRERLENCLGQSI